MTLDAGVRSDRHEYGRLDGSVRSVQQTGAGARHRALRLNFKMRLGQQNHCMARYAFLRPAAGYVH